MEAAPSPPQEPLQSSACAPTIDLVPTPAVEDLSLPLSKDSSGDENSKPITIVQKNKTRKKKIKKRRVFRGGSDLLSNSSSACSSSSSSSFPAARLVLKRRSPRPLFGAARRREGNVAAIALPFGMSVAALVALVRNSNLFYSCLLSCIFCHFYLLFLVGKSWFSGEVLFWWRVSF